MNGINFLTRDLQNVTQSTFQQKNEEQEGVFSSVLIKKQSSAQQDGDTYESPDELPEELRTEKSVDIELMKGNVLPEELQHHLWFDWTDFEVSSSLNEQEKPNLYINEHDGEEASIKHGFLQKEEVLLKTEEELQQLLTQVSNLFDQLLHKKDKNNVSLQMWRMLEKWTQFTNHPIYEEQINKVMTERLTKEEQILWKQLHQAFEKRINLLHKNMYSTNASVTSTDVKNWLEYSLQKFIHQKDVRMVHHVTTSHQQPLPMNEVQQHTFFIQGIENTDVSGEELVKKLHQVVHRTRFIQQPNMNQLVFHLKPENLGNMTIRLMQIDGEMTVKIVVSTQIAKEMLESNSHQLKSMFAPHQIVIERDELTVSKEFEQKENSKEQKEQNESSYNSNNPEENQEDVNDEGNFEEIMYQITEKE